MLPPAVGGRGRLKVADPRSLTLLLYPCRTGSLEDSQRAKVTGPLTESLISKPLQWIRNIRGCHGNSAIMQSLK